MKFLREMVVGALAATVVVGCSSADREADNSASAGAGPTYSVEAAYSADANAKLPATIRDSGILRVVTTSNFPPFASQEGNGPLVGLAVDLSKALGSVLGVEVKLDAVPSVNAFIPGLQSDRWDTAVSPMADTIERQKQLDFIDYYVGGSTLVFSKENPENITNLDSICGKPIAIAQGSSQVGLLTTQDEQCKAKGEPATEAVTLPDNAACLLAVRSGKAAAAFLGEEPIAVYVKSSDDLARDPNSYATSISGIAVLKGNDQLRDAIQLALQQLMDSGLYKQIIEGWGLPNGTVPKAVINTGTI